MAKGTVAKIMQSKQKNKSGKGSRAEDNEKASDVLQAAKMQHRM